MGQDTLPGLEGYRNPDPEMRGRWLGLEIHRRFDPKKWREQVDLIDDAEAKPYAEAYLRNLVEILRAKRKREAGRR